MAEIIKLGSIYFDDQPQEVGAPYNDEQISLGDAAPGQEISWVRLQSGLLIADRCVCTDISWEQLDEKGLVFGAPVTINGITYLCRCLRVGSNEDEPNEWDTALNEAGEDDDLWHWEDAYFWGQEISKYDMSYRAVRGYFSARYWGDSTATDRDVGVGFRPALEYLGSEPCSPDTLLNKMARAYCQGGVTIEGCLVDFSNYDIVLKANSSVRTNRLWARKEGRNIIIRRENVVWLEEG